MADIKWKLVWRDEFDGEIGSVPDPARWSHDLGGHGWGNRELQTYTDRAENASIVVDPEAEGGRALGITAIKAPGASFAPPEKGKGGDGAITSARITTRGLWEQTYGRFEARIKIPEGQGIWPAFWLLGADMRQTGWPECGEIDVMEWIGRIPETAFGTLHGPGYSGDNGIQGGRTLNPYDAPPINVGYHLYAVDWLPDAIHWYVDGGRYHAVAPSDLPAGAHWPFDHPFYIILNLAVGGNWPGYPDASTRFPQTLYIDYVRVYERDVDS